MNLRVYKISIIISLIFVSLCGCFEINGKANINSPYNPNTFVNTHEHYYGKVVKVVDGDTVYVKVNGHLWKIRLLGVDTPETYKKNNPYEYYLLNGKPITNITYLKLWGEKAKYFAKKNLENKTVIIVFDNEAPKKDRYGRYLAYVFINESGNLIDFNEELLKYGYARVYISKFELENRFLKIEKEAKANKIGLWDYNN